MRKKSWTNDQLQHAVQASGSIRQVIRRLGLIPAGGNYRQVTHAIERFGLRTTPFKGQAWSRGLVLPRAPMSDLSDILVQHSYFNTSHLRERLFKAGLKERKCEECGWEQQSLDGRIPVELDHINGDHYDNRLENLHILCSNCHSLKTTHRGRNKGKRRGGEMGRHATLKTL